MPIWAASQARGRRHVSVFIAVRVGLADERRQLGFDCDGDDAGTAEDDDLLWVEPCQLGCGGLWDAIGVDEQDRPLVGCGNGSAGECVWVIHRIDSDLDLNECLKENVFRMALVLCLIVLA